VQIGLAACVVQRRAERFGQSLEVSLNEPGTAGVIGAEFHCGVAEQAPEAIEWPLGTTRIPTPVMDGLLT